MAIVGSFPIVEHMNTVPMMVAVPRYKISNKNIDKTETSRQ